MLYVGITGLYRSDDRRGLSRPLALRTGLTAGVPLEGGRATQGWQ